MDLLLWLPNIYNRGYKTTFYKGAVEVSNNRQVKNKKEKN